MLAASLSTLAVAQTQEGNAGGFEIDDCGTLFSGTGNQASPSCTTNLTCTNMPLGDDWAQGPAFNGVLDNNGQPTIDPDTGDPYRAELVVDQNWGNQGGGADATQFAGNSNKNNDYIGDPLLYTGQSPWTWNGTGGGPQKNDITNTYIHARTDPATGHTWLILGAETRATNGDSHVDFEFNIAGLKICDANETQCSGPGGPPPAGVTSGLIIGRGPDDGRTVNKDFIVSIDFTQGGVVPNAVVRLWTETSPGVFSYQTVSSLGIDTTGKVYSSTNICTVTHDTGGGAWHHFTGDGAPTSTMLAFQMVETGIDLTGLGIDVNPCSPDATVLVKTRSSQSFTAELKDFSLAQFPLNPIPQCQISGPALVCPGEGNIQYTATETTGLASGATFDWTIAGNATFCDGSTHATGASVCVNADSVCNGTYQLVVTVTVGPCSSTCLLMVDVNDTTEPTIDCPGPITVQCDSDVPSADTAQVSASDNCGSPTVTWEGDVSDGHTCPETITRTYRATDECGNTTDCTQLILVDDTIPPEITCPGPVTVQCHGDIPAPDTGLVIASDNCTTPVVTWVSDVSDGNTCPETVTRTYRATDACGNSTDCNQTIVVHDTIPPQITCPPSVTIECDQSLPPVDLAAVHATDNCSTPTVTWQGDQSNGRTCPEIITRTYRATDACGNYTDCSQLIVIRDTTPPVITCPPDVTVQCMSDVPDPDPYKVVATDNCSTPIVQFVNDVYGNTFCPETISREYKATDECGNVSYCTQNIVIDDTTPPVIRCPLPVTVQCPDDVPPPDARSIYVTDNCTSDVQAEWAGDVTQGTCPEIITRTYMAHDDCDNVSTCTQTIVVDDTTPPVITCPPPITIQCDQSPPPPDLQDVYAADNCGTPEVNWIRDVSDGKTCPETITRYFRATDNCDNMSTCTQTITVVDTTPPEITCPPNVTVQCRDDVPPPDPGSVHASDNCSTVTVYFLNDSPSGTCPTIIDRTYEAEDDCGNTSQCHQTIVVNDTTPPEITCPPDVTIQCDQRVPDPDINAVQATDNCSTPTVTWEGDQSDHLKCPEIISRTYRATDACGNFRECTQHIVIVDTTPPTIQCPPTLSVQCPTDVPPAEPELIQASDNCGPATVRWAGDHSDGQTCPNIITRTYVATDDCGNETSCTQMIIVDDTIPPQITCPPNLTLQCDQPVPPPDTGSVNATDNCGIPSVIWLRDLSNGQICPHVITRIYGAVDNCNNLTTCSQTITIVDTIPPQISCPPNISVQCIGDVPAPDVGSVTAFDNCSTVTVTWEGDIPNGTCPESILRTYRATDACGNFNECHQVITVADTTPPEITCPPNVTIQCDQSVPSPDPGAVIASDNCSTVTVTWEGDHSDGQTCPETISRTYRATDACGNYTDCTQHIVIVDTTPPTVSCPGDIDATCTQSLNITITASDNCDSSPTIDTTFTSSDPSAFTVQPLGNGHYTVNTSASTSITVTSVAYDECGNASQPCSFVIRVTCGQACSPGYWRQPQHFNQWCLAGYQPVDNYCGPGPATLFVDAFALTDFSSSEIPATFDPNMTLLTALQNNGGDYYQTLFQGSAALLSAASPNVAFGHSVSAVQQVMQEAFAGTITFKQAATQFASWNSIEQQGGCPLP